MYNILLHNYQTMYVQYVCLLLVCAAIFCPLFFTVDSSEDPTFSCDTALSLYTFMASSLFFDSTAATIFPPCFFALDHDGDPTFFCDKGVPAEAAACCLFRTTWFRVRMVTAFYQGDTAEFLTCSVLISATHKGDP